MNIQPPKILLEGGQCVLLCDNPGFIFLDSRFKILDLVLLSQILDKKSRYGFAFLYSKFKILNTVLIPLILDSESQIQNSKLKILDLIKQCGVLSVTTLAPTSFRWFSFSHKTFSIVESITEYFAALHESNFWEITHKFQITHNQIESNHTQIPSLFAFNQNNGRDLSVNQ